MRATRCYGFTVYGSNLHATVYSMVNRTVTRMHTRRTVHPTTYNAFRSPHVLYSIL